jgi:hypothetical protein
MVAVKTVVILLVLACAACSSTHTLTECRGRLAAANPGKWQPTLADLTGGGR